MQRQEVRRMKRQYAKRGHLQNETDKDLIVMFLALTMEALHDEFGFGEARLKRYASRVEKKLDCINADYVTFSDILENLNIKLR